MKVKVLYVWTILKVLWGKKIHIEGLGIGKIKIVMWLVLYNNMKCFEPGQWNNFRQVLRGLLATGCVLVFPCFIVWRISKDLQH